MRSIRTDATFEQSQRSLILRVLLVSSIVIYVIETLLMLILELYFRLNDLDSIILDGLILVIFLFPINYLFIARPMARQIAERHRINQDLLKSNELLERFFAIDDILIAYMDARFTFMRVNQAYVDAIHRTTEDLIGYNHFALFPDAENQVIFQSVIATGKAVTLIEKPFMYPECPERGASYWDLTLLPVKNPRGQVDGLILVLNDVTERKTAQSALTESERRFHAAFNQTFQHSALLDSKGKVLDVNQTAIQFTGIPREKLIGMPLWQLPWWDFSGGKSGGIDPLQAAIVQAAEGRIVRSEYRVRSANHQEAVMDITLKPLTGAQGETVMLIYEARDITDHIRAEETVKRSEVEIKRLYEAEQKAHHFVESLRNAVLALSGSLDSNKVLKTLLDYLHQVIPFTSAHILLIEDEDHLIVRLSQGDENPAQDGPLLSGRLGLNRLEFLKPLLEGRETLSVPDTSLGDGGFFSPQDARVRSWLAIPLLAGEQGVGLCLLEHESPGFLTTTLSVGLKP